MNQKAQIAMLLKAGFKEEEIVKALNVTQKQIKEAALKETEERRDTVEIKQKPTGKKGAKATFTEDKFTEMKKLFAQGLKIKEVAKKLGFSEMFIQKYKYCTSYAEVEEKRQAEAARKRRARTAQAGTEGEKIMAELKQLADNDTKTPADARKKSDDAMLATLTRIAVALEKIADNRKRGLFRK